MADMCDKIQSLGKGLGNPCRYRILEYLMRGPRTVGEIVKNAGLSQPAVSQHLKTLKMAGLVEDEKRGQEVFYSLNAGHMLEMLNALTRNIARHHK